MIYHELFKFALFVGFPKSGRRKISGVYSLAGLYVGASMHVRERILSHLRNLEKGKHESKELQEFFNQKKEQGERLKVEYLSENVNSENYFIKQLGTNQKMQHFKGITSEDTFLQDRLSLDCFSSYISFDLQENEFAAQSLSNAKVVIANGKIFISTNNFKRK